MSFKVNSEYRTLKAVLLKEPAAVIEKVNNPLNVLYRGKIDYNIIKKEFRDIINLYKELGIEVYLIDADSKGDYSCLYNLMYVRDLFFMTPEFAIIARMSKDIREKETLYVQESMHFNDIPFRGIDDKRATFEGADILWINEREVLVGVGKRTNKYGFKGLKKIFDSINVKCLPVEAPHGVLHLLGAVQLIDGKIALVRKELVGEELKVILKNRKIDIIEIPENEETRFKYSMNIVTFRPKEIIMPANCPLTRDIYLKNGIEVIKEISVEQFSNGGGGIACATGILSRR